MRLLWPGLGMFICLGAEAGELAKRPAPIAAEVAATPLRTLSTAPAVQGAFFAWVGPALCDENENAYFLVVRPLKRGESQAQRHVLRVSADGKTRITFDPATVSKFADAREVTTESIALDPDGGLFLLVWARWTDEGGQSEKGGQYIVSLDKKGEYRSHFEVDWSKILVEQFEVFGSGQFLLRGRRPDRPEPRLAILSATGGALKDVVGWAGLYKPLEEPGEAGGSPVKFDQIARGGDGRIYIVQVDARENEDVVFAFRPSGDSEEVFTLQAIPKAPHLLGWKASGDRFAATYLRAEPHSETSAGERRGSYWIAVYSNVGAGGELEPTVHGPAPGPPVCYRHEDSGDRFTFLQEGKLVTMSAP